MASGTITGTTSNEYITARITWTSTPNTTNNTSTVKATLAYKKNSTYGNATYSREFDGSITINGNKMTIDIDRSASNRIYLYSDAGWVTMGTHTVTVAHTSDGSKSITISATGGMSGTSFTSTSCSGKVELDTIPRASSITSASAVTLGNKCSIKWTPLSSSFVYKVKLSCGGVTYTSDYITPGSTSAYTYSATMSVSYWAKAMPKAYSGTCTATLYTYQSSSSSTAIGSSSKTFTLTLPSTVKPTVSFAEPEIVNGWNGYYIQGKSKCKLSATFAAGTGSSISSCSISGTELTKTGSGTSLSGTTSVLTKSGTFTYTAKVTDGRKTVSATKSIYVYPYANPTLSISAVRTSTSGSVKITYKAACSSVNSKNSLKTLKIYQKLSTDSTWPSSPTEELTLSSTSANSSKTLTGLSTTDSYDFKAVVTDTYGSSSAEATASVSSEFRLLNINDNKKGLALGKMSEDNTFDCNLPMKISSTTTTQSEASFHINSSAAKSFTITRTGLTDDIDQDDTKEPVDIRGQFYVNDDGNVTLSRRYSTDNGANYTTQGFIQLRDDRIYAGNTFEAPRGRFTATDDAAGDTQNNVALRIGSASGEHIDIDNNEIIAKDNTTTMGVLALSGKRVDLYGGTNAILQVGLNSNDEPIVYSVPVYNRTYDSSSNMCITSNGVFGRSTSSSKRYKTEIEDVRCDELNPYQILDIPIRQYKYKEDYIPVGKQADDIYLGFIAEEVEEVFPAATEYDEDGQAEMWNIKVLFPALLKVVQDQQKEIQELKKMIMDGNTSSNNME